MLRIFHKWQVIAFLSFFLVACGGDRHTPAVSQDTGCSPNYSSYLKQAPEFEGRITYCENGDASTGELRSKVYAKGTRRINVMMAGYPGTDGMAVLAVPTDGSPSFPLSVANIGDSWKQTALELPPAVQSRTFYLKVVDNATGTFGWAGLGSIPRADLATTIPTHLLPMALAVLTAHLWLALVGCLLPTTWNATARSLSAILILGAASSCIIVGYVASPLIGEILAYIAFGMPLLALLRLRSQRQILLAQIIELNRLLLPSLLLTSLIIWIGLYPFSWDGHDWQTTANRWRSLPVDAWIPLIFADMISSGRIDVPMIGDWLSSDRPPLQSGIYLIFLHSWLPRSGLIYQALSTWAQSLILIPLLVFVVDAPKRPQRAAIIFVIALSPLVILNGLFVWPKLLAASFCAIFHIALFGQSTFTRPARWLIAGAAAAFAMLSHGGALFALVGSTGAMLILRRREAISLLFKTGALAITLYAPWIAYQRYIDPPGDRLLKWHFAGRVPVTQESFASVLHAAYADLSFSRWLDGRAYNLNSIVHGSLGFFSDAFKIFSGNNSNVATSIVENSFFYGAYSMWFASPLLLLPCLAYAFIKRRILPMPRFAPNLALSIALSALFWIVAIYEPGQTVIHQGAYFTFVAAMLLVLILLARCFLPMLYAVAALNCVVAAYTYAFNISAGDYTLPAAYVVTTLILTAGLLTACTSASAASVEQHV